jgi:large subunit ribosomal protein L3
MNGGLLGRKVGMTQIFDEDGRVVPVTVVEAGPCTVLQVKTEAKDGYNALQLGFGERPAKGVKKPESGHFKKSGAAPKRFVREVRVAELGDVSLGAQLKADYFSAGEKIDVEGKSIGRGFAGGMKRHGFQGKGGSHGVHKTHRRVGSLGSSAYPARVFPGKRLPGHFGDARTTIKNLTVVKVLADQNLILVHGAVPGPPGGYLILKKLRKA